MDRISNLPDVVIEGILDKLSLADQVRTSVLSSCWRYKWAQLPSLVIDSKFYQFLHTCKPAPKKPTSYPKPRLRSSYLSVINSLLVQRLGHLRKFSLFIPSQPQGLTPAFHLPLQYVVRNGIKSLFVVKSGSPPYVLPLFSSPNLKYLELQNCELRPAPAFCGFPNLVRFIQHCSSAQADTISYSISSCPLLKEVELLHLKFPGQVVNINAPRLDTLLLSGEFKSISLCNPQNINRFLLGYNKPYVESPADLSILRSMTNLQQLQLGDLSCQILVRGGYLPKLDRLESLCLYDVSLHDFDDLICMLSISTTSPNLKKLTIVACIKDDDKPEYLSFVKSYRHHNFGILATVRIEGMYGSNTQMSVIELFLCCAPHLELITIKFTATVVSMKKLSIAEKILDFCRASPKAKVKFLK